MIKESNKKIFNVVKDILNLETTKDKLRERSPKFTIRQELHNFEQQKFRQIVH